MNFLTIVFIGLGGAFGAILRALSNYAILKILQNYSFPFGTLLVNLVGSFFIGFLLCFAQTNYINANLKYFLVTGVLGGLTTFSAFTYENMVLIQSNSYFLAFANIVLNLFISLLLCYLGFFLARIF